MCRAYDFYVISWRPFICVLGLYTHGGQPMNKLVLYPSQKGLFHYIDSKRTESLVGLGGEAVSRKLDDDIVLTIISATPPALPRALQ